jgi:hypothetical protein
MKKSTYFGGNSVSGASVMDGLGGFIFDVSVVDVDGRSSILFSSLSRPPSDELSWEVPLVAPFARGCRFAGRGRLLP